MDLKNAIIVLQNQLISISIMKIKLISLVMKLALLVIKVEMVKDIIVYRVMLISGKNLIKIQQIALQNVLIIIIIVLMDNINAQIVVFVQMKQTYILKI